MFPIEEVARISGLTKRTIRYYEEVGLLAAPERTAGGHRLYEDQHVETLQRIKMLHETLGLSLADLKEFLTVRRDVEALVPSIRQPEDDVLRKESLLKVRSLLDRHLSLMDAQMAKLQAARNETERLVERVERGLRGRDPESGGQKPS